MQYRPLGSTGLKVSVVAFGAGPVPAVMTSGDLTAQTQVVRRAIEAGINWFDTAAGYGQGKSESALGAALAELGAGNRVNVATKVRLAEDQLSHIDGAIRASVEQSLSRLRLSRVTLLQLHNSITAARNDEPTSLTPGDVLGSKGVLEPFLRLKSEGIVGHIGLTGIGQAEAMRAVVRSGAFETIQIPYNVVNPSAGRQMPESFKETNYGNLIADCAEEKVGVFAIRALAGGALAGNAPSAHTLKTPFFALDLYQRDVARARELSDKLHEAMSVKEAAIRFALSHSAISAAIVGFTEPGHVDEAVRAAEKGPLPADVLAAIGGDEK